MKLQTDEPPLHKAGCDGTDQDGPCAACIWVRERLAEDEAWKRWYELVVFYPRNLVQGYGIG